MLGRLIRVLKGKTLDRTLQNQSMEERFTEHYRSGWWFANGESRSGSGSTLDSTEQVRASLVPLLTKWNVTRFLDAPCGDWNWMQRVELPEDLHYIGADIVPDIVVELKDTHARPGVEFMQIDITADPLPDADMMMCRDALFHLSEADIFRFFRNFASSNIEYLLTTHMPQVAENRDIVTGKHRPLNLEAAPFMLSPPIDNLTDYAPRRREKYLSLWKRSDIVDALARHQS